MNEEILKNWREFSESVERYLKDQIEQKPEKNLEIPSTVLHQFSGADGVRNWQGASNMTTPLKPHSFFDTAPGLSPYNLTCLGHAIRRGDPQWAGDLKSGSPKRRVECSWEPWRFPLNEVCWAGAAFFLPSYPMKENTGTSIFQIHNHPNKGVLWNLHVANGKLASDHRKFDYEFSAPLDDYLDRWCRMVISFRASTGNDGFIKLWLDDDVVMSYSGPTREDEDEGSYFKHGVYNWGYDKFGDTQKSALAYFDRLTIAGPGSVYATVDPEEW